MFYYLSLPFVSLFDFFDRGGPVILILFIVAIIMITLLVERLIFFINDLKSLSYDRVSEVEEYTSENKWIKNKIKLGVDLFERKIDYKIVNIDESFPDYIVNNKNMFKDWIL